MARFVLLRLGQAVPTILLTSIAVWYMVYLIPGDPTSVLLGPEASQEQLERARQRLGFDRPLPIQYALWLRRALNGDLGASYLTDLPVWALLKQRILVTLHLAAATILVSPIIAIPLGVAVATRRRTWLSRAVGGYTSLAMAVPTFWLGILLVLFFGVELRWLPASGYAPIWDDPGRCVRFLLLPTATLSAYVTAVLIRFTEAAVRETLEEDYVRTARAKGLSERVVVGLHVLRNSLLPVVTVMGLQFGTLMGGAVITESIFAYPGLGRMLVEAIFQRDYAVVQGTILFVVCVFVVINLVTDILYAYLDPRIRYVMLR